MGFQKHKMAAQGEGRETEEEGEEWGTEGEEEVVDAFAFQEMAVAALVVSFEQSTVTYSAGIGDVVAGVGGDDDVVVVVGNIAVAPSGVVAAAAVASGVPALHFADVAALRVADVVGVAAALALPLQATLAQC